MKTNQKGFTLIELLVVIAIIGLLSTLSILSLNSARARARDAKRISDVKQIQTALEMYYNEANDYPTSSTMVRPSSTISYGGNIYMKSVPLPPSPSDGAACGNVDATNGYTYTYYSNPGGLATYGIQYCLGSTVNSIPGNTLLTAGANGMKQ